MKLAYRYAQPSDWEALQKLHWEQQAEQGTNFEIPWLFARPIVAVIVGCDEDGAIRQCFYGEAVVELRVIGGDPRATAQTWRQVQGFSYLLKELGYRYLECFVPQSLKKYIGKPLMRAGFEDKEAELAYFSKDLRG